MLFTEEHYEVIKMFEKEYKHLRLDKENKNDWKNRHVYQNGETNNLFLVYLSGYALGKATYINK
jgi:hypothetical protein